MALYNLKSAEGDQFRITKFDADFNPESSYLVSQDACECPQFVNRDKRCRHMKMLKHFLKGPTIRLDTQWFYDFDRDAWFSPITIEDHDGQNSTPEPEVAKPEPTPASTTTAPSWRRL